MAYIGLRKPWVGERKAEGSYAAPVPYGKAVSFSDTPSVSEASLYGDDGLAEFEKATTSSALSLGTTDYPDAVKTLMFGHTAEGSEYAYGIDDESPYVGFAIIGVKKVDGVRTFEAKFYPKTQWKEPTISYATRGDSTSFATPSTEGTALPDESGNYKYEENFENETDAIKWVNGKFGVTA